MENNATTNNSECSKEYPQGFYSLGNSINKVETVSLTSSNQFTSNIQSSQDTKSSITWRKAQKKKKVKKINFSDRMLSSKLYSIKRQEIFLYDSRMKNKVIIFRYISHYRI